MQEPRIEIHGRLKGNGNVHTLEREPEISRLLSYLERLSSATSQHLIDEGRADNNLDHVRRACANLNERLEAVNEEEDREYKVAAIVAEWQFLATVLDRIFLMLYLAVIIGALVLLFPR